MNLSLRLTLTALLGFGALVALFYFQSLSYNYYTQRNTIQLGFKEITATQYTIIDAVAADTFFLYSNQDQLIEAITKNQEAVTALIDNTTLQNSYPQTHLALLEYQKYNNANIETYYDFQTSNTVIKNSIAAIPILETKLTDSLSSASPQEIANLQNAIKLAGTVLVAKNAMDAELMLETKEAVLRLKNASPTQTNESLEQLLLHFTNIINTFPEYSYAFNKINDSTLATLLTKVKDVFDKEATQALRFISYFSYFLVLLFISSLVLISFFLIQSERKARTDGLTTLGNRKAYEERVRGSQKKLALLLINIRKFKNYNDFYGIQAGDKLLIATAKHIKTLPFDEKNPSYYRLGADDFGILYEPRQSVSLEQTAKKVLTDFSQTPIILDGEERTPTIQIAASDVQPLLETTDMALKSNKYHNPIIYHEALNLLENIQANLTKAQELKTALEHTKVIPYFQPIVNLSDKKVIKHEILARVVLESGEICSIFPYLHIATESNLYHQITQTMIEQSFPIIATHKGEFSLNLSIEDINNPNIVAMIEANLNKYPQIGERVIFEILESEAIGDYKSILAFIQKVRVFGCKIAIDDFGSGYSNFSRILNLEVDIIKIDGSLVKDLATDSKAITIIETILSFTKKSNMLTVAEFVHDEATATIVESLGVDTAQGFFFYKPAPQPLT